jgi:hypothetical protein
MVSLHLGLLLASSTAFKPQRHRAVFFDLNRGMLMNHAIAFEGHLQVHSETILLVIRTKGFPRTHLIITIKHQEWTETHSTSRCHILHPQPDAHQSITIGVPTFVPKHKPPDLFPTHACHQLCLENSAATFGEPLQSNRLPGIIILNLGITVCLMKIAGNHITGRKDNIRPHGDTPPAHISRRKHVDHQTKKTRQEKFHAGILDLNLI